MLNAFLFYLSSIIAVRGSRIVMDRTEYFSKINVNLSWTINTDTQSIYIEMVAPISISDDLSWIAFGLSDTGGMKGADMALISLYHEEVYDLHSVDFVLPQIDKIQNWKLMHLERFEMHSIIQIKRHLLTCDAEDFGIKTDRLKHNLMIAYSKNDQLLQDTKNWKLSISMHPYYERKEVNMFVDEDVFMQQNDDENENFFDFGFEELAISKSDGFGQYWCQLFNVTEPRYLTGGDLLDMTSYGLVHHVVLQKCANVEFHPTPHECGADDYRIDMECEVVTALAVGSSVSFQSEIYYLLEPGIYNLEIHFDLVSLSQPNVDVSGSGLRLYWEDNPRKHRAGIIGMSTGDFVIPPMQKEYAISAAMFAECTEDFLPESGIDILYILGHMHYLGDSLRVDRIRKPNLVQTIYEIRKWDFDRQFYRPVHYKLFPGDTLRLTCFYDSMSVENETIYGKQTWNEMCQVWIGYIDKIDDLTTVYSKGAIGKNAILNPSYCGSDWVLHSTQVESGSGMYENHQMLESSNRKLVFQDDTNELCETLVYDEFGLMPNDLLWNFDMDKITLHAAVVIFVVMLVLFQVIECILVWLKPGIYEEFIDSNDDKRKINIYIGSVIIYTVLFIMSLYEIGWKSTNLLTKDECALTFNEYDEKSEHEFAYGLAFSANIIITFCCFELIYRAKVTWDLYLHHVLAFLIIICVTHACHVTLSVGLGKILFYWLLQFVTEQPIFIALFIRKLKLKIVKEENYPKMFYFAVFWHYFTKVTTTIMIWYYWSLILAAEDGSCDSIWYIYDKSYSSFLKYESDFNWKLFTNVFVGIISFLLFSLQTYQGYAFYLLGRPRKSAEVREKTTSIEMKTADVVNAASTKEEDSTNSSQKNATLEPNTSEVSSIADTQIVFDA